MNFLLRIFDSKSVNVHEEAFLAVGAIAAALSAVPAVAAASVVAVSPGIDFSSA